MCLFVLMGVWVLITIQMAMGYERGRADVADVLTQHRRGYGVRIADGVTKNW